MQHVSSEEDMATLDRRFRKCPRLYENSNVQHFAVKADIRKRKLSGKIRQLLKADSEATYALLIRAVLPQLSMPFT